MEVFTMNYQFYYNRLIKDLSRDKSDHRNKWAKENIAHVKADMARGDITVDSEGVVRNCIGRCLMDDLLAVAVYIDPSISVENTQRSRDIETQHELDEYVRYRQMHGYSDEELAEMRATFGPQSCVDVLTGRAVY